MTTGANISNATELQKSGLKSGNLIFIRKTGSGEAGDIVRFAGESNNGVMIDVACAIQPFSLVWKNIVEFRPICNN